MKQRTHQLLIALLFSTLIADHALHAGTYAQPVAPLDADSPAYVADIPAAEQEKAEEAAERTNDIRSGIATAGAIAQHVNTYGEEYKERDVTHLKNAQVRVSQAARACRNGSCTRLKHAKKRAAHLTTHLASRGHTTSGTRIAHKPAQKRSLQRIATIANRNTTPTKRQIRRQWVVNKRSQQLAQRRLRNLRRSAITASQRRRGAPVTTAPRTTPTTKKTMSTTKLNRRQYIASMQPVWQERARQRRRSAAGRPAPVTTATMETQTDDPALA